MARYGGIQGFAGLFMIGLLAFGLVQAGWRGLLTALLASWNAWPAIAKQERINPLAPTPIERAQRLGGIIGALLTCGGLVYGGWRWGWAWGSAGFILGLALGFTTEAIRSVFVRVADRRAAVAPMSAGSVDRSSSGLAPEARPRPGHQGSVEGGGGEAPASTTDVVGRPEPHGTTGGTGAPR